MSNLVGEQPTAADSQREKEAFAALQEELKQQRRRSRFAAIVPLIVAAITAGILLPLVWQARSAANTAGQVEDALALQREEHPDILPGSHMNAPDAVRALSIALVAARWRLAREGHTTTEGSEPRCLPSDVVNACDMALGPNDAVVMFATGRSEMSLTDKAVLFRQIQCRGLRHVVRVEILGFADRRPSSNNKKLSDDRAKVVADQIKEHLDIDPKLVFDKGLDATFPASLRPDAPNECQRVAVVKVHTNSKP